MIRGDKGERTRDVMGVAIGELFKLGEKRMLFENGFVAWDKGDALLGG